MSPHPEKPKKPTPPPARPWRATGFSFEEKHTKAQESEIARGLEKIYLTDDAKTDKLSVMKHKKRRLWLRIFGGFVAFCAVASVLAWAGLIFLAPNTDAPNQSLELTIDGPERVTLGEEQSFDIHWKNISFQPVSDAELRLAYPTEFQKTYASPWPTDATNEAWKLGIIPAGASGDIKLKGIFIGNIGTQGSIQAIATYRSNGDTRSKQALLAHVLSYADTVFDGAWDVPPKSVSGDQINVAFNLHNRGSAPISGQSVRIAVPQGFLPVSTTGSGFLPVGADNEWELALPELAANATTSVRLAGSFVSGTSGDEPFKLRVGSKRDNVFVSLFESNATMPVLAGDLSLRLVVNGSDSDRTIAPGDPLHISIAYKNVSPENLGDVKLVLSFESDINSASATGTSLLDWKQLQDASHGVSSTKPRVQTISYDQAQIAELASLPPGQEGSIDLEIPSLGATSGTHTADIQVTLDGTMATVGKDKLHRDIKANPITLHERSDADLTADAHYFTEEGAPLGSGPLPPVAGKTTVYRINWTIKKTIHPLENLDVSAVLPANAVWNNSSLTDAGDLTYDDSSRTVHWTLNKIPEDIHALGAWFDVALTPADLDIGRFARLLGDISFSVQDPVVSETIESKKPAITTDLQDDAAAEGKGVVRQP